MKDSLKDLGKSIGSFFSRTDYKRNFALASLWTHWLQALGPALGSMVKPVHYTDTTLVLGVEDSQVMQEMVFYVDEIQERLKKFLGWKAFDKIQFELLNRRTPLSEICVEQSYYPPGILLKGKIAQEVMQSEDMDPSIPEEHSVGRCYRAFVRKFGPLEK